jgi:hypothetical protein
MSSPCARRELAVSSCDLARAQCNMEGKLATVTHDYDLSRFVGVFLTYMV